MRRMLSMALAAAFSFGLASEAGALAVSCEPGQLCIFEDTGTGGQVVRTSDRHRITNKLAKEMNNAASSVRNNTSFAAFLYSGKDAQGNRICILPGATINDLSTVGFDDAASSSKVKRHVTCP